MACPIRIKEHVIKVIDSKISNVPAKPGVEELFESNPELANDVYEALGFIGTKSVSTLDNIKKYLKEEDYRLKSPAISWITDPTTTVGKMLEQINTPIIKNTIVFLREQNKKIQELKTNANLITNDLYKQAGIDPVKLLEDESTQIENIQRVQRSEKRLATPELDKLNALKTSNRNLYEQIEDLGNKQFKLIIESSNAFEKEVKKFFNSLMEYDQKEIGTTITPQQKQQAQEQYSQYLNTSNIKQLKQEINSIWKIDVVTEVNLPGIEPGLIKDENQINSLVARIYEEQTRLENNLQNTKQDEQIDEAIIDDNFMLLLQRYKANTAGVIPVNQVNENTYFNLQKELDKLYPNLYVVKIEENGDLYISLGDRDVNVFKEEVDKNISYALSTSILKNAGVSPSSIQLIKKIGERFSTKIRIISESQLRYFPTVRKNAKGFYDPSTNTAYLILEKIKDNVTLHEAFSHPFVNYIKDYNPGLYNALLSKALANPQIVSHILVNYSEYSPEAKEMETIIHALDLEYEKELKDASLLKSIVLFWKRIIDYLKNSLGITTDIDKFTTFKEIARFVLNSDEKMDLTNLKLKDLEIMEFYEDEETSKKENEEISDEILNQISLLRKNHSTQRDLIDKEINDLKNAIRGKEIVLTTGEVKLLDTFTARISKLSSDLNKVSETKNIVAKNEYLAAALTLLRSITRKTGNQINIEEVNRVLDNMSMVSQILEESLVVTALLKEKINSANESSAPLIEKQKEISQYYRVLEAVKESIKPLEEFYLESSQLKLKAYNPVTELIQEIKKNIAYSENINSIVVVDSMANQIHELFSPLIFENIDKAISIREQKLQFRIEGLQRATNPKDIKALQKDISDLNNEILNFERKKPTLENIKKTIKGEFGDTSYLKYMFDAAFNSEDVVVAGFARVIEKIYMKALDDTQIMVNKMQVLLDKYMDATGKTNAEKQNLSKFYDEILEKVTFKRVKTVQKIEDIIDPETKKVTQRPVFEQTIEEVTEDQLIGEFDYYKLQSELDILLYNIREARKSGTALEIQEAIQKHKDFKKTYFETPLTEEYEKRIENSNIITEQDLKGLKDENGNPLSLSTNPELAFAAKEKLGDLYDKEDQYFKMFNLEKNPSTDEMEEYQKIKQKIRALSSINVHGSSKIKTGIDLAIARAVTRSENARKGVFGFKVHTHAQTRYNIRLAEKQDAIIGSGLSLDSEEAKEQMRNFHKIHSKITKTEEYYKLRNNLTTALDTKFNNLKKQVPFISSFLDENLKQIKSDSLDALWKELGSKIKSLKDLENTVNGTLADESLQKDIQSLIEAIETQQNTRESLTKLTNRNQMVTFDNLVRDMKVKVNGVTRNVKNFEVEVKGKEQKPSLLEEIQGLQYSSRGAIKLQKLLKSIDEKSITDANPGVDLDDETIELRINKIRKYLFLNSGYTKTLAVRLKLDIYKKGKANVSQNNKLLEKALNEEMQKIVEEGFTTFDTSFNVEEDEKDIINAIKTYDEEVNKIFQELSKLTKRENTEYYEETVKALKETIFSDLLQSGVIKEKHREINNYDQLDQINKDIIDEQYEDMVTTGDYSLYFYIKDLVEKEYKNSEWYKNNHYKKLEIKNGIAYKVSTPTPLWTSSEPVNDDFKEIKPNNSYAKRFVNEFLLDKNNNPTNIRLKRTDINDRVFGYMTPKKVLDNGQESPYLNQRYKEIKRKNPKLLSVLNELTDLYYEAQRLSGVKGLNLFQFLPRMVAEGWELVEENGRQFVKRVITSVENTFKTREEDVYLGIGVGDFSGKIMESIPVKFLADIPYEMRSRDVFGNIVEFIAQAHLISGLNELYPAAKEFHKQIDKNSPAVTKNNRIIQQKINEELSSPLTGLENTRADHILHIIQTMILNKRRKELNIGNYSLTKTLDSFSALTSFSTMAGFVRPNLLLNTLIGKIQTWLEVWSNGLINREDYNEGVKTLYRYFASDFVSDFYKLGQKSVMGQLLIKYNSQSKDLFELFGQELKNTKFKDIASTQTFFKTRRLSEFELTNTVTLALLAKAKVMDNGKQITLIEAYTKDKDGNIKLKDGITKLDGTAFTQEDEYRLRVKATSANLIIHGNYSKHLMTKFDTTALGPQISLFRKHLMSYRNKTWGTEHIHYGTEEMIQPYNRKALLSLWKVVKNIRNTESRNAAIKDLKLDWKETNYLQKGVIHNGIIVIASLLLALIGEDEDENPTGGTYDSFMAKTILYQLLRIKSDLELFNIFPFFSGLDEAVGIYKNPSIAISRTGFQYYKTVEDLFDYLSYRTGLSDLEEKDVTIQKDYYGYDKGTLKVVKDFGQLTGLTGATLNPGEMADNFLKMSSSLYR